MRGYPSTPFIYESCKRFKEIAESHDHEIVILYFGDSDKPGRKAKNIESGLSGIKEKVKIWKYL